MPSQALRLNQPAHASAHLLPAPPSVAPGLLHPQHSVAHLIQQGGGQAAAAAATAAGAPPCQAQAQLCHPQQCPMAGEEVRGDAARQQLWQGNGHSPGSILCAQQQAGQRHAGQCPHLPIPVPQLVRQQVLPEGPSIARGAGSHSWRHHSEGMPPVAQAKVVCSSEDGNAAREVVSALAAHILLEGCTGCAPAVHLPVKQGSAQDAPGQGAHVGAHVPRGIGPRKGPAHVAGSIPHVLPHAVRPPPHVILQGCSDPGHDVRQAVGQQQAPPRQLCQGQAAPMPARLPLRGDEQRQHSAHHVIPKVCWQAGGDAPNALGAAPAHHSVAVPQA